MLSSLFITGNRLTNPFKPKKVIAGEKTFLGKRYPTYFHVKGKAPGKPHQRECHINMRCRVIFETDAVNDYFSRDTDRGEFTLEIKKGEEWRRIDPLLNLFNGIATISFHLPEKISVGEILHYRAIVNDPTQLQPFINEFSVKVKAPATLTRSLNKVILQGKEEIMKYRRNHITKYIESSRINGRPIPTIYKMDRP